MYYYECNIYVVYKQWFMTNVIDVDFVRWYIDISFDEISILCKGKPDFYHMILWFA